MAGMLPAAGYGFRSEARSPHPDRRPAVARLLAPLRTAVLVPLIGVLAVATTWFGLYLAIIARWTP
jgi:hypothetical protein